MHARNAPIFLPLQAFAAFLNFIFALRFAMVISSFNGDVGSRPAAG